MCNYHLVKQWHEDVDSKKKTLKTGDSEEIDSSELSFNRSYVRQKLESGLYRFWNVRLIGASALCICPAPLLIRPFNDLQCECVCQSQCCIVIAAADFLCIQLYCGGRINTNVCGLVERRLYTAMPLKMDFVIFTVLS